MDKLVSNEEFIGRIIESSLINYVPICYNIIYQGTIANIASFEKIYTDIITLIDPKDLETFLNLKLPCSIKNFDIFMKKIQYIELNFDKNNIKQFLLDCHPRKSNDLYKNVDIRSLNNLFAKFVLVCVQKSTPNNKFYDLEINNRNLFEICKLFRIAINLSIVDERISYDYYFIKTFNNVNKINNPKYTIDVGYDNYKKLYTNTKLNYLFNVEPFCNCRNNTSMEFWEIGMDGLKNIVLDLFVKLKYDKDLDYSTTRTSIHECQKILLYYDKISPRLSNVYYFLLELHGKLKIIKQIFLDRTKILI